MSATSKPSADALTTRDALLEWLGYAPGSRGGRWASVGGQRDHHGGGYMVWKCADGWHVLNNYWSNMLDGEAMVPFDIEKHPEHTAPTFIDALIYICKERYGDPDYVTIAHFIAREEERAAKQS